MSWSTREPDSQGARGKSRAQGQGLAGQSPAALSWVQRKTGDRGQKGPTEV